MFNDEFFKSELFIDNLADLYEFSCEDKDPYTKTLTITGKDKLFVFNRDLEIYFKRANFKFEDGSTLTISKNSSVHRL